MRALLVAPVFDDATRYSYEWSREAKKILEEAGFEVIDLSNREISRSEVNNNIDGVDILVFFNHGTETALLGSRNEAVLDTRNVSIVSGKTVYTLACLSAKKLGVEAYKAGAEAYWGYTKEFAFSTDALEEFKAFAVEGIRLKFKLGKTWSEALQLTKNLAKQLSEKLVKEGKYVAAVLIESDAEALVCYNAHPPKSTCPFRRLAIKLLGPKRGWKLSLWRASSFFLLGLGLGLAVHDFFVECQNPLRFPPHGFWFGVCFIIFSYVFLCFEMLRG